MEVWIAQPSIRHQLSDENVTEVTLQRLRRMIDGDYIQKFGKEDWLVEWEDTGHGSGLTTKIRKVTDDDRAVLRVIEMIKQEKNQWPRK